MDEFVVVISNFAVALVTGILIVVTLRESNRHKEVSDDRSERSEARLVGIVHQVLEEEHELEKTSAEDLTASNESGKVGTTQ